MCGKHFNATFPSQIDVTCAKARGDAMVYLELKLCFNLEREREKSPNGKTMPTSTHHHRVIKAPRHLLCNAIFAIEKGHLQCFSAYIDASPKQQTQHAERERTQTASTTTYSRSSLAASRVVLYFLHSVLFTPFISRRP